MNNHTLLNKQRDITRTSVDKIYQKSVNNQIPNISSFYKNIFSKNSGDKIQDLRYSTINLRRQKSIQIKDIDNKTRE